MYNSVIAYSLEIIYREKKTCGLVRELVWLRELHKCSAGKIIKLKASVKEREKIKWGQFSNLKVKKK